ncbi:colanic acid biosynthesis glycosyltransferase WcaL [Sporolactobacillus sp. THM7-7]|nr:colanic acid biosynthesis glycosyltransferase WcaL [Sporolactobacillus sp. THM7-7]
MKILVIVGVFPKLSQTFILNQITGFIDAGHEVTILAKKGEAGGRVHEDVTKYRLMDRVIYYGSRESENQLGKAIGFLNGLIKHYAGRLFSKGYTGSIPVRDLIRYPNLILLIRKLNQVDLSDTDIVQAHFGPNGILAQKCLSLGLLKGRLFTVFHGYDMLRYVKQKGKGAYRELFASAGMLLPISRFWEKRLVELGADPSKIVVHHMGIDPGRFLYCPARPKNEIHIVSAARFVEKKGLEYGIRAVGRLIEQGFPIRYSIVGGGPLETKLKQIVSENHWSGHIHFLGWKTQDELIAITKRAHLILVPSVTARDGDMEGIPVQLMESMAMGKIVVSTRHSGIPELIHDRVNGFLVQERDIEGLAQTIRDILSFPVKWPEIAADARQTIVDAFNIRTLNKELLRIFAESQKNG